MLFESPIWIIAMNLLDCSIPVCVTKVVIILHLMVVTTGLKHSTSHVSGHQVHCDSSQKENMISSHTLYKNVEYLLGDYVGQFV